MNRTIPANANTQLAKVLLAKAPLADSHQGRKWRIACLLFLVMAVISQCASTNQVNRTQTSVPDGWQLAFSDEFDGAGSLDVVSDDRNWRFESMDDALHRAGNQGMDEQGRAAESWRSPKGKRWSAWYNAHHERNAHRTDGNLVLGGYVSGEPDPTRPLPYLDEGVQTQYGNSKLYTVWLDTFSRKWIGPGDLHVVDPDSPGKSFKYGYFEMRVNFSQMKTPGFRMSMWLMPASSDVDGQYLLTSDAYDEDGNNGVEIDIFEYEWVSETLENRITVALQGGDAGKLSRNVDVGKLGIQLHEDYHTIGLLWLPDQLVWLLDGQEIMKLEDVDLIPDVYSYLILSREMNSGVKSAKLDNPGPDDALEKLPYVPRDPGLYAKNIWAYRSGIDDDKALIDYVRVWQP